jgi:hypothetical protein
VTVWSKQKQVGATGAACDDRPVIGPPEPLACWNCAKASIDVEACSRCGAWLTDLDARRVPPALRPLLGLARQWGISDDGYRWDAVERANRADLETIVRTLDDSANDEMDRWLVGPEADATQPSREYVGITCLVMAADHARLRLTEVVDAAGAYAPGPHPKASEGREDQDQTLTWPMENLNALRLGRRLVAEVPAAPGRCSFVDIRPAGNDSDSDAAREGWRRSDPNRSFQIEHWDFDQQQAGGWDRDIGAERVRATTAANENDLLRVIASWGLRPVDFQYPWNTADPR